MITLERETQLKPIQDLDGYHEQVLQVMEYYWFMLIYKPLLDLLRQETGVRANSRASLLQALKSGRVSFSNGHFFGQFNAAIAKELRQLGAKYVEKSKAYRAPASLPTDIRQAIAQGNNKMAKLQKDILQHVESIQAAKPLITYDFKPQTEAVLADLDRQFKATVAVPTQMTKVTKKKLEESYVKNLDLYINDWTDKAIVRLREKVQQNVLEGFRADKLMETIQAERGVTHNKAKFLARQETSLLVSKFRQERYEQAGITKYRWATSHDERVRSAHKELNGKVFLFSDPPVTNPDTGEKNNPGEDFNCRCVAIPLVPGIDKEA